MTMPRRKRVTTNLIDADSCTFNKNYRNRILFFIRSYQKVLQEFSHKSPLSEGEKILIDIFVKRAIKEQKKLAFNGDDLQKLTDFAKREARLFYAKKLKNDGCKETDVEAELAKLGNDFLINNFIFHHIQYAESICPEVLRTIFILANKALIEKIISQTYKEDKVFVMLGSNRQSYSSDQVNMRNKGTSSIYRELGFFVKYINSKLVTDKVVLDKFTLSDIYEAGDFEVGKNFKKIIKSIEPYAKNAFDVRKVNILYAVMNYITQKYPDALHTFNLFDDQMPILDDLKLFFSHNPSLFMKDTCLNLQRYYMGKFSTLYSIQGTGVIDHHFVKNVCLMAKMCGYDPEKENDINIAEDLDVKKFLEQRLLGWECEAYMDSPAFFKKSKSAPTISSAKEKPALV